YNIYAEIAEEEGNKEISELFQQMARNEREHAKIWYKILNNGFDTTLENLKTSVEGENDEWKNMYPQFAQEAREEGLEDLASMFDRIASIEYSHDRMFTEKILNFGKEPVSVIEGEEEENLYCIFCGYMATAPIKVCPVCGATESF
ncbi:MAG: rubrerythrin family protein, partial [Anaerotignaceae bacterium]